MLFLAIVTISIISTVYSVVKVNPDTHGFVDEFGREVYFHGVNAVYKVQPWHPLTTGFDPSNSLSDIDAKYLKGWGFNVVRLGVMWPGVEPQKDSYDSNYLDQIETIVRNLANQGIYTILDFHQDLFHRKFCGEGVPDYVYETCIAAQPKNTKPFPLPVTNETYPNDKDGVPELSSCLSKGFASYYFAQEVGAGFQCLYNNVDGLWDSFANYWKQIAIRFKNYTSVLGYELFNEPWVGNLYEDPKILLPKYAEKNFLQPLYEYVNKAIRSVDDEHIIFFEGLTIDYWPNGFTSGPGGPSYNDRQALAYHIYCLIKDPSAGKEAVCDGIQDEFFYMRKKDVDRIGGGMIMTEFGASRDIRGDLYALEHNCAQADKYSQSWVYWQYKYYQDLTTMTPTGESLFNDNGTVVDDKVKVLSRTYPQAIAGSKSSFHFNPLSGEFTLTYTLLANVQPSGSSDTFTTKVYYNKQYYYPHGVKVSVESQTEGMTAPVEISCDVDSGYVNLKQTSSIDLAINVEIVPCTLSDLHKCTCN